MRQLATELSTGAIELPSFPDVALRVQKVLSNEKVSVDRIVRVIGAEPMIATRVLTMANSVAMNPQGKPVTDLRAGGDAVGTRCATLSGDRLCGCTAAPRGQCSKASSDT